MNYGEKQLRVGCMSDADQRYGEEQTLVFHIVEDLRSTNGTFLGATRLTEPREVAVGSVLRIGQTVVELQR